MKQYSNFSLKGYIIVEELLYTIIMLSIIFFSYEVARFLKYRVERAYCYSCLNSFLNDFQRLKEFSRNFNHLSIYTGNLGVYAYEGKICLKYSGKFCCYNIGGFGRGYLSRSIVYENGEFRFL